MAFEMIVASDSHGRSDLLEKLEKAYPNADLFVHCGDLEDSPENFPHWVFVRGNNDWTGNMPDVRKLSINGHGIYVIHSDRYNYRQRERVLADQAKKNGCDIALYGHTHCSNIDTVDGVLEINPGSMWMPRDGNPPSYARVIIEDDGTVKPEIIFEPDWPFDSARKPKKDKKERRHWFW